MKDSFNFASLEGIRKAYKVIFPKSQGVLDVLGRSEFVELEASRHLVVHCCGIVDDEFCRKSGLNLKIGDKLPITDKLVFDYLSLIADVALVLLRSSESLVGSRSRQKLCDDVIKE